MKLSEQSIGVLANIITGDSKKSPYRSGPLLISFFNPYFDQKDTYGQGFPTRWYYARDKLLALNDTDSLRATIESVLDPRNFLGTTFSPEEIVSELNQYFEFDGWHIVRSGKFFKVSRVSGVTVQTNLIDAQGNLSSEVILQNLQKADRKLEEGDFSGAITNARSLVETVLLEIERRFENNPPEFNGDLGKLFGRVQKHLELDPGRKDIADTVRQLAAGLMSVVSGLAGLRNKASDAHGSTFNPGVHHARLAVNAAKTICDFIADEYAERKPND